MNNLCLGDFISVLCKRPQAVAVIRGCKANPDTRGRVLFYEMRQGVIVRAEITGLPQNKGACKNPIFAFHIHEGDSCTGIDNDPFSNAKGHYNPDNCPHPYHAGDMPPLFGVNGTAFSAFLPDRFRISEIIGRTVIIHIHPDDFMTQPSGGAGEKIACGVVVR